MGRIMDDNWVSWQGVGNKHDNCSPAGLSTARKWCILTV